LPWGLQILLISLVTLAAFIYRKPFQHLFAAVGYSAVGSRKSEEHFEQAVRETRKRSTAVATAAVPGTAGYRFGRWSRRESGPTATAPSLIMADDGRDLDPAGREAAGTGGTGGGVSVGSERRGRASQLAAKAVGSPRGSAPPLNLSPRSQPPASPSGGKVNGGTLFGPRSGAGRPQDGGSSPSREDRRPRTPSGTGSRPPSSPSWGAGGSGAGGQGSGGQASGGGVPPRRQGAENGGRGWFGGGNDRGGASSGGSGNSGGSGGSGNSGGSGGGRSWFGGRGNRRDSDGGSAPAGNGPGRGTGGTRRDPASTAKGNGNSGPEGGGRQAPPLWSGKSREEAPEMPFWLRPVKREDGEE
jgi:hypothetical protein